MSLRFTLHDSSKKKSDWAVKPVWFGSSPSCEKELPPLSCFHMVAASDPEGEGQTLREVAVICERSTLDSWEGFRRDLNLRRCLDLCQCVQVRRQTALWVKEVQPVLLQEWSQEVMGLSMQEQHLCTTWEIPARKWWPMGKHNTLAELFTRRFLCCFTEYSNWIAKPIQSWREWAEWQYCHIWEATRVFRSWTNTGIHFCHSSRPGDGTAAAPTDVAHPRWWIFSIGQSLDFFNNNNQCSRHQQ